MRSQLLGLALLALVAGGPALAGEHDYRKADGLAHGRAWCPHCGEACYPTVTKGKETKHCFNTETKPICIPKVRFPWESGGKGKDGCAEPKCGRTKYVNVLLKHEYECSVCKYSWDPGAFKDGAKNDGKYQDASEPAAGEPSVEPPPSVEARRPEPRIYVQPASSGPSRAGVEPSPTRTSQGAKSFLSKFFK